MADDLERFLRAILVQDVATMQALIAAGFDVNTPRPGRQTLAETAQWGKHEPTLRTLWAAGAHATTPFLRETFDAFAAGEVPPCFRPPKVEPVVRFASSDFVLQAVPVVEVAVEATDDDGSTLRIRLAPFAIDDEVVSTALVVEGLDLPRTAARLAQTVVPPPGPDDLTDGSVYLRGAHHRADLRELTFGAGSGRSAVALTVALEVDFDAEGAGFGHQAFRWQGTAKVRRAG